MILHIEHDSHIDLKWQTSNSGVGMAGWVWWGGHDGRNSHRLGICHRLPEPGGSKTQTFHYFAPS